MGGRQKRAGLGAGGVIGGLDRIGAIGGGV
jgi:hypothetical protein